MEVWRAVQEFPQYEVSTLGRIRNIKTRKERKPDMNSCGYGRLRLQVKGGNVRKFIHRCVAEAFLDRPEGKSVVDHIDGNRSNNALTNLRWTTQSENLLNGKVRKSSLPKNIIRYGRGYRWRVRVSGQVHRSAETYPTPEDAYAAFVPAAQAISPYIRLLHND